MGPLEGWIAGVAPRCLLTTKGLARCRRQATLLSLGLARNQLKAPAAVGLARPGEREGATAQKDKYSGYEGAMPSGAACLCCPQAGFETGLALGCNGEEYL